MRICFISDTHCQHPDLPNADLLIHCGDLTGSGSMNAFQQEFDWLKSVKHKFPLGIIFVPGNHDKGLDQRLVNELHAKYNKDPFHNYRPHVPIDAPAKIRQMAKDAGIQILIDEACEIEGVKFYGSPLTPTFMSWAFMNGDIQLGSAWKAIPDNTQVLITHGPPKYILDQVDGRNVGSETLTTRVKEMTGLKVHAFGHIHEGAGYLSMFGKLFVNASSLDGEYRGFNPVFVVKTDDWQVDEVYGIR